MAEEPFELLGAFLDGDRVDPREVAALLARPEGQAALLDFAILKAAIAQDDIGPRPEFIAATERRLAAASVSWRRVFANRRMAAAAALIVATAGGFWIGSFVSHRDSGLENPPVSRRTVDFQRGVDWTGSNAGGGQ